MKRYVRWFVTKIINSKSVQVGMGMHALMCVLLYLCMLCISRKGVHVFVCL